MRHEGTRTDGRATLKTQNPASLYWAKYVPGTAVSIPVQHAFLLQSIHVSRAIEEKHGRRASEANGYIMARFRDVATGTVSC